jgi:hypothetical protein
MKVVGVFVRFRAPLLVVWCCASTILGNYVDFMNTLPYQKIMTERLSITKPSKDILRNKLNYFIILRFSRTGYGELTLEEQFQ